MIRHSKPSSVAGSMLAPAAGSTSSGAAGKGPGRRAQPSLWPAPSLEGLPRTRPSGEQPGSAGSATAGARQPALRRARWPAKPAVEEGDFLLDLYLRDTFREPVLQPDEECDLGWLASFEDADARRRLVLGCLRLVVQTALQYRGLGLPLCDLISEGNLGLMRAVELFDPVQGVPFARYAVIWVRHRMRRALTHQAWPMRLPADLSWQRARLRQAEARFDTLRRRPPADDEMAAASGLSLAAVRRLRAAGLPQFVSLQSPVSASDEERTLADTLADEGQASPDEALARHDTREFVEALLATLTPRARQVLRLRFGFDDGQARTLEEVGQALGYVRQGVHKIEAAALGKLRRRMRQARA